MNVTETAYTTLRRRLTSNHYEPGVQLKEEAVATDLGISRTPVRAAIARLIAEGLLMPGEKRGAIVTPWRKESAEEIFNLRILLEGYAAFLCARHARKDQILAMQEHCERMEAAFDKKPKGWLEIMDQENRAIHGMLFEGSGSAHLRLSARHLLDIPMVMGGYYIFKDEETAESLRHHRELVKAIEAGNGDWARAVMACHLNAALARFLRKSNGDVSAQQN